MQRTDPYPIGFSKTVIYEAINVPVLSRVPQTTKRLLDLGCGSGALGRRIKEQIGCEVIGVTNSEPEASLATEHLDRVLVRDLNGFDPREAGEFDCVIGSHVLEHLSHPEQLLKLLQKSLTSEGRLIIALPNVLYWQQRLEFLRGRFKYTDGGLMDRTHYRFFDWLTAQALLVDNGYQVEEAQACGAFPLSRYLSRWGRGLDSVALKTCPGLFGHQFIFVCHVANH